MKVAPIALLLAALFWSLDATAEIRLAMPGMTGDQLMKLKPERQSEVLAKAVREGSAVSRDKCSTGKATFLQRLPSGASFWRMDCVDSLPHLVSMPPKADQAATVLACSLAKTIAGIDCQTGQPIRR